MEGIVGTGDDYFANKLTEVQEERNQTNSGKKKFYTKQIMLEKIQNNKNPDSNVVASWETVGARNLLNEKRATFADVSHKYLPINLPPFLSEVFEDSDTKYIIPLTINIKPLRGSNNSFKGPRLLCAMMKAFQMAFQDTYIGSINKDDEIDKLTNYQQVPLEQAKVEQYMMEPIIGMNKSYSTKIIIHSNHELKDFINNQKFQTYITTEMISIEYNNLNSVIPYNIGFLEQVTSSRDTLLLHENRIKLMLPVVCPEFQVNLQKFFDNDHQATYVVMLQSSKDDVPELTKLLLDLVAEANLMFFPWKWYQTMTLEKRLTIFNDNRNWNFHYKSIIVTGFMDNDDNVQIKNNNEGKRDDEDTISVSEYLRNITHPLSKDRIFEYVYPTTNGTREFIVNINNIGEAENYVNYLKGQLAKDMEPGAIIAELKSPSEAMRNAHEVWRPFARIAMIKDTKITSNKVKNKRIRMSENHQDDSSPFEKNILVNKKYHQTDKTYSQAVVLDTTDISTFTNSMYPKQDNNNLHKEVLELKQSVKNMKEHIQMTSNSRNQQNKSLISEELANLKSKNYAYDDQFKKLNEKIDHQSVTSVNSTDKITEMFGNLVLMLQQTQADNMGILKEYMEKNSNNYSKSNNYKNDESIEGLPTMDLDHDADFDQFMQNKSTVGIEHNTFIGESFDTTTEE